MVREGIVQRVGGVGLNLALNNGAPDLLCRLHTLPSDDLGPLAGLLAQLGHVQSEPVLDPGVLYYLPFISLDNRGVERGHVVHQGLQVGPALGRVQAGVLHAAVTGGCLHHPQQAQEHENK